MIRFYVSRQPGAHFVALLTLAEIRDKLDAGRLKDVYFATESDGRSFSSFVRSGGGNWRTLAALLLEFEREETEEQEEIVSAAHRYSDGIAGCALDLSSKFKADIFDQDRLLQALQSSVFHFRDPEILTIFAGYEKIHQIWRIVEIKANSYQLPLSEIQFMQELVDELSVLIPSVCKNAARFEDVLKVVSGIFESGASLIEKQTMLTGLTSGFSLTGSRDRVHDGHFNRLPVYFLMDKRLDSLEQAIKQLLRYGELVAIDDSPIEPAGDSSQASGIYDGIQTVLVVFGHAMSRTTPGAFYAQPPSIWQRLQDIASKLKLTIPFVDELRRRPDVAANLRQVLPEIEVLVADAQGSLSDDVTLEGIFGAKKGIKQLRAALVN